MRGKKRVTEGLDHYLRHQYVAKLRPSGQYQLQVPYRTDEDLDRTMEDLLLRHLYELSQAMVNDFGRFQTAVEDSRLRQTAREGMKEKLARSGSMPRARTTVSRSISFGKLPGVDA